MNHMPSCLSHRARLVGRGASALLALVLIATSDAGAQRIRTLTACTPDALAVCAELRLTTAPGAFELAVRTVGSAQATLPISIYNLVLGTGAPALAGVGITTPVAPMAVGGAVITDAAPWELFDSGEALFLSALSNHGVGGCVVGPDVGGFGQAGRTCGDGQFFIFSFVPTSAFDLQRFTLLNLEAVGLTDALPAVSCGGDGSACAITGDVIMTPGDPSTTVPEPLSLALVGGGLMVTFALARVRGRRA